jgi:PAS domain S-box
MSIPVIREGKAVAILAVANKDRDYDETDLLHLSLFIENIWDESKRKQAEGDLKREKEFLDNLIKTAPVIVLVLDIQGSIVSFNPYMEHLSGYLLDEVRGKNWFDTFLRKDDAAKIRDVFSQAIHDVDTQGNVNLIVAKNGREIIIEWDAKTLKDADGRVVGLLSVGQDITERDRAERELRWKTALLESQIEADIDGVLVVDSLGQRILVNSRLLEMWEVPERIRNDKLDAPLLEYVVGRTKNPEQFLAKVNYLYSHETETSRDEVEFKDGIIFDRYSSPVKDKQGAYLGRIWTFRDITERKRAETALKEIAGFLQHLIDAIPSPIFYKDTQGVYRGCNAAFEKYLGLPKEKIVGMSAHDLSPKELADKYLEMDLALLRQGGGSSL